MCISSTEHGQVRYLVEATKVSYKRKMAVAHSNASDMRFTMSSQEVDTSKVYLPCKPSWKMLHNRIVWSCLELLAWPSHKNLSLSDQMMLLSTLELQLLNNSDLRLNLAQNLEPRQRLSVNICQFDSSIHEDIQYHYNWSMRTVSR